MSERFGKCHWCKGNGKILIEGDPEIVECGLCGGTGFSGGVYDRFKDDLEAYEEPTKRVGDV